MAETVRIAPIRNRSKIALVPAKLARALVQRGTHVYVDRQLKGKKKQEEQPAQEYKRRDMKAEGES